MKINDVKRPWVKSVRQGNRYNKDSFYHSSTWRSTRSSFRMLFTTINGVMVPNTCCVDCFKETGRMIEGKNTDHIVPRKAGGSDEHHNLQTQCDRHHAVKSSNEGKKQPGK